MSQFPYNSTVGIIGGPNALGFNYTARITSGGAGTINIDITQVLTPTAYYETERIVIINNKPYINDYLTINDLTPGANVDLLFRITYERSNGLPGTGTIDSVSYKLQLAAAPTTLPPTTLPATTLPATTLPQTTRPTTTLPQTTRPATTVRPTTTAAPKPPTPPAFTLSKITGNSLNVVIKPVTGLVYELSLQSGIWNNVSGTNYTINTTGLVANTTNTVSVRSRNSAGTTSSAVSRTFLTLPAGLEDIIIRTVKPTSVVFSLPSVSGVSYYYTNGGAHTDQSTSLANVFKPILIKNNTIGGLRANTEYELDIWTSNKAGYSLDPLPLSFTTAPAAPAVTVSSVTTSGATLTIKTPVIGLSYRYYYTAPGQSAGISGQFNGSSLAITGLLPNKSYTYYVSAENSGDYQSPLTKVTFKTARTPAAPRAVMIPRVYLYGN